VRSLSLSLCVLVGIVSATPARADHWRDDGNLFVGNALTGGSGTASHSDGEAGESPVYAITSSGTCPSFGAATTGSDDAHHRFSYVDDNGDLSQNTASLNVQVSCLIYAAISGSGTGSAGITFPIVYTARSHNTSYDGEDEDCGTAEWTNSNQYEVPFTVFSSSSHNTSSTSCYGYFNGS
jgi:hypothetical protein